MLEFSDRIIRTKLFVWVSRVYWSLIVWPGSEKGLGNLQLQNNEGEHW